MGKGKEKEKEKGKGKAKYRQMRLDKLEVLVFKRTLSRGGADPRVSFCSYVFFLSVCGLN